MVDSDIAEQMRELGCDESEVTFVLAFCRPDIRYNATAAYLEAYETENKNTARAAAARKMAKPHIKRAVALYRRKVVLQNEEIVNRLLGEMDLMAHTSPLTQFLSIKGKVRVNGDGTQEMVGNTIVVNSLDEVPPHVVACVKSIKQTKYGLAVEFYPRDRFMELLGRSVGMFTENLNVTEESYEAFITRLTQQRTGNGVAAGK